MFKKHYSRFPSVNQDIAIVIDEDVPAIQVQNLIELTGGKLLIDVELFDVYYGKQIGAGKKSLAYRLTFQDKTKTLTLDLVARERYKIVQKLEQQLNAKLRS